jgi:uncharacterized membrane protein
MEIVTRAVDKAEELLGHSPHPAIVTIPMGAFTVSNVSDTMALITGDDRYDHAAQVSMAVGLVGSAAAAVTGLRDYGKIPKDRQPNHKVATTHAIGNMVMASLFATSYAMRIASGRRGRAVPVAARLIGLAGGALAFYTGWLGGKLVDELGEAVHPVMERWQEEEQIEDRSGDQARAKSGGQQHHPSNGLSSKPGRSGPSNPDRFQSR